MARNCPSCGRANDDDARFCSGCGAEIASSEPVPAAAPPAPASPAGQVPPAPPPAMAQGAGGPPRKGPSPALLIVIIVLVVAAAAATTRTMMTMSSAGPGPLRGGPPAMAQGAGGPPRRGHLAGRARLRRRRGGRSWLRGRDLGAAAGAEPRDGVVGAAARRAVPGHCPPPGALSRGLSAPSYPLRAGRQSGGLGRSAPAGRTRRRRPARRARLRREISAYLAVAEEHEGGGGHGRRRPEREGRPRPHGAPEQPAHRAGGEAREPGGRVVQA